MQAEHKLSDNLSPAFQSYQISTQQRTFRIRLQGIFDQSILPLRCGPMDNPFSWIVKEMETPIFEDDQNVLTAVRVHFQIDKQFFAQIGQSAVTASHMFR